MKTAFVFVSTLVFVFAHAMVVTQRTEMGKYHDRMDKEMDMMKPEPSMPPMMPSMEPSAEPTLSPFSGYESPEPEPIVTEAPGITFTPMMPTPPKPEVPVMPTPMKTKMPKYKKSMMMKPSKTEGYPNELTAPIVIGKKYKNNQSSDEED